MSREDKTHREEVRPFVVFMLTGGFLMGTFMVGMQRYLLGFAIAIAGCVGGILLALTANILDRIES
jgi:membrane associated rhomboid family serine protease